MSLIPDTLTLPVLDALKLDGPRKRVGVLGGSFNPIHNGHIQMGLKARAEFGLTEVLYVVAGDPPHKKQTELAPAKERFEMTELALSEIPGLWSSDVEMCRLGHTYTVDTMRILQSRSPEADFLFLIGEDTLFQLETWKDFGQLCRIMEFACFLRPGAYGRKAEEQVRLLGERYEAVIHLCAAVTEEALSATRIRELVREGKSIRGLVPPAVEEYIHESGLYVQ